MYIFAVSGIPPKSPQQDPKSPQHLQITEGESHQQDPQSLQHGGPRCPTQVFDLYVLGGFANSIPEAEISQQIPKQLP